MVTIDDQGKPILVQNGEMTIDAGAPRPQPKFEKIMFVCDGTNWVPIEDKPKAKI
jgi:hypothetical protein